MLTRQSPASALLSRALCWAAQRRLHGSQARACYGEDPCSVHVRGSVCPAGGAACWVWGSFRSPVHI